MPFATTWWFRPRVSATGCALDRYEGLTGWKAPAAGGPPRHTLEADKVRLDTAARLTIAAELGHSRLEIARQYVGA